MGIDIEPHITKRSIDIWNAFNTVPYIDKIRGGDMYKIRGGYMFGTFDQLLWEEIVSPYLSIRDDSLGYD